MYQIIKAMVDVNNPNEFYMIHNASCEGAWERRRGKCVCSLCGSEHSCPEIDKFWGIVPSDFC